MLISISSRLYKRLCRYSYKCILYIYFIYTCKRGYDIMLLPMVTTGYCYTRIQIRKNCSLCLYCPYFMHLIHGIPVFTTAIFYLIIFAGSFTTDIKADNSCTSFCCYCWVKLTVYMCLCWPFPCKNTYMALY